MALRLIELVFPEDANTRVEEALEDREVVGTWQDRRGEEFVVLHLLVKAEETEPIMDRFEQQFSALPDFRMVLFPVEAALPRQEAAPEEDPSPAAEASEPVEKMQRVSREELHEEATDAASPSRVFLALTFLSAIVAAVGLMRNDMAVIIGAMVIAPLLGPNVALALATTLDDRSLAREALKTSVLGFGIALVLSVAIGLIWTPDPDVSAIASRTRLGYDDLLLALAAGSAGTFAFTSGLSGAVIGVMMAVALLPPLVTFGMLLGSGNIALAMGAGLLTAANIICVNLAGVATFLVQGVRPRSWWEAEKAKRRTRRAAVIWAALLGVLIAILFWINPAA